ADRLREARRARRVQDVAGRVGLELRIQIDAQVLDRAGLVVAAQQRGPDGTVRPERVDGVDLLLVLRRVGDLVAVRLLEQADDGLGAEARREQQRREAEAPEREQRDEV